MDVNFDFERKSIFKQQGRHTHTQIFQSTYTIT